jgi:alkane 1-monooxygenase
MFRDLKYLIAYIAPASALLAVLWQGTWSYATLIVAFGLIPLIEQFAPGTTRNLTPEEEAKKTESPLFDLLLYLNLPILYAILWLYFSAVRNDALQTWEVVGMTISVGILTGTIGINVGHELGHRRKKYEQIMAKALLTPALYTHFYIEHNRGHHVWVSTPQDPSSAKLGENLYHFWLRSVYGTYINGWRLENDRLRRAGKPVLSFANEMIWLDACKIAYLFGVGWFFGWVGVGYAVLVAIVGFLLLETVNYIEHYGLSRKLLPNGFYEKVAPWHSWNSNHELGRIFLYELTRHSDHHYKATRKYQILRHFDESPQLPHGYPASMLLALVPPLWFAVMDKKVKNQEVAG